MSLPDSGIRRACGLTVVVEQKSGVQRANELYAEAQQATARAFVEMFEPLEAAQAAARAFADLATAPPGIRDRLRRLAEHIEREIAGIYQMGGLR